MFGLTDRLFKIDLSAQQLCINMSIPMKTVATQTAFTVCINIAVF